MYAFATIVEAFMPMFCLHFGRRNEKRAKQRMVEKRNKKKALAVLIKQYPEYSHRIEDLIKENPDFKQMCEDYQEVAERLAFWTRQAEISNHQIKKQISENRELLQELKLEILLALKQEDF